MFMFLKVQMVEMFKREFFFEGINIFERNKIFQKLFNYKRIFFVNIQEILVSFVKVVFIIFCLIKWGDVKID